MFELTIFDVVNEIECGSVTLLEGECLTVIIPGNYHIIMRPTMEGGPDGPVCIQPSSCKVQIKAIGTVSSTVSGYLCNYTKDIVGTNTTTSYSFKTNNASLVCNFNNDCVSTPDVNCL